MRTIVATEHGGLDVLRLTEHQYPRPGPGEVVLRLAASGVNYRDVYERTGSYSKPLPNIPGAEGEPRDRHPALPQPAHDPVRPTQRMPEARHQRPRGALATLSAWRFPTAAEATSSRVEVSRAAVSVGLARWVGGWTGLRRAHSTCWRDELALALMWSTVMVWVPTCRQRWTPSLVSLIRRGGDGSGARRGRGCRRPSSTTRAAGDP